MAKPLGRASHRVIQRELAESVGLTEPKRGGAGLEGRGGATGGRHRVGPGPSRAGRGGPRGSGPGTRKGA